MQNPDWKYEARKICWLALIAATIGWFIDELMWALLLVAIAYIGWSLRQLQRLQSWLYAAGDDDPPEGKGAWGALWDNIYRREADFKKERVGLQQEVDYLRDSFASLGDAVVMIDRHGCIDWSNQSSETLLGLHYPEDTRQQLVNLIRSPDFIEYYEARDFSKSLNLVSPINPELQLNCQITYFGKGSRLLFARDVTEHVRLQQMRSDFVANASHELRTPLTVISGYLSHFLSMEQVDKQHVKAFQQMSTQATRMEALIKDLLLLSRLETLTDSIEQQDIDMLAILESIREEVLAAFKGKRLIHIDCDSSLHLLGNGDELRSAFTNLAMNAAKYTEPGGHICMRWHADDHNAYMEVADNGIGVESQHIPRLTERFYRVDKSRSTDTGGTGLGLAIVKHVLIRHNAKLKITSDVARGSVFTCVFPLSQTFYEQPAELPLS
jgi:two-component system phosphate regulon sensor histidine kinase PhoR